MTRRIRVLPDAVANQIAAGEVVERPASVVKELVENALDAGASRIDIRIEQGGKRRIRIGDDGIGMGREDALVCLDRHATSKIATAEELSRVRTLGFRGEALPSIAAVSRMTLETSDGEGEVGTRISVDGGRINLVEDLARQRGTTVEVRSLFFNAPARAKFLRAAGAETRAIAEVVTTLALTNPGVAFDFFSDDRALLQLPPTDDLTLRVGHIWGEEEARSLLAVEAGEGGLEIHGLIQRPDAARPGHARTFLAVNGRAFRSPSLVAAARRGYRTTVAEGVRPWVLLFLRVPGDSVDVNVHPAKAEVRFREEGRIEAFLEQAVRQVLQGMGSAASFGVATPPPVLTVREVPARRSVEGAGDTQMALFTPGPEATSVPALAHRGRGEDPVLERPRLWQVLNTYIIAETRDGILIVDQHSAHERVLFERLMRAFATGGQEGQRLLFPLTVRLTPPELACVQDLAGLLDRAGFEVEGFGGDTVIVHSVPNPHRHFDAPRAFREMVAELTEGSELVRSARNQHERIAMSYACKSAIKAGHRLSESEMQELFDQLFATELPHHDVHGRPTVVRLSAGELARRFGRS